MSATSTRSALSADRPFPGLRPYRFEDKDFFFGRQDQIFALYRLFDHSRFVAVVGSSGSGKSSLVRAGLLPLLAEESLEPTGRIWKMIQMHPGDTPLGSLATALAQQFFPDDDHSVAAARRERLGFALRRSSFGMSDALREIDDVGNASIILVVHQFEELFRYAGRQRAEGDAEAQRHEEATQFVQVLLAASRDRALNVYVLLTMRSDFIGDCANFRGLPEAVSASQFLVPSLTRNQREEAIRLPVENAGATIEAELVERLLNDSGNDIDQLPVLQHCLLRVWEAAGLSEATADGGRCLTVRNYEEAGGISHALSKHADEILEGLRGAELAVQQTFRSLAEIDLEGRIVRRALPYKDLLAETGVKTDHLRTVVDRFRDDDCSFLTPSMWEKPELTDGTRVDVGHEALLRRWERVSDDPRAGSPYVGWIREEVADGRAYRGLLAMAESRDRISTDTVEERWKKWQERPRTAAWAERYGGHIEDVERLFAQSFNALRAERDRQRRQAEADREQERQKIEEEAERKRITLEAAAARDREAAALRFARLARAAAIIVSVLLLIAIALGAWSFQQRQAALQQRRIAESNLSTSMTFVTSLLNELQQRLDTGTISVDEIKRFLTTAYTIFKQYQYPELTAALMVSRATLLLAFADTYSALQDYKMSLQLSEEARSIATQLTATDPRNSDYQNLRYSADFRIGDAQSDLLDIAAGMQAYTDALSTARDLAASDPTNHIWMQNVAIILNKIGDDYKIDGQQKQALQQYQAALAISQKLADANPSDDDMQRNLANTLTRIGDLLRDNGSLTDAATNYNKALTIRKTLADKHPSDASIQSNLSVVYNRVGGVLVQQNEFDEASKLYNLALIIRQNLAKSDRSNASWQSYLAFEYIYIGDMLVAKSNYLKTTSDYAAAAENYRQALHVRDGLAALDPNNFTWLKNLVDSQAKLADVLLQEGDADGATAQYQDALNVIDSFLSKNPDNKSLAQERQYVTQKLQELKSKSH